MSTYRTGGHHGITIIREGTQPADQDGRRTDDEFAMVVIDADRLRQERLELADLTAWLLTGYARVAARCDCGHHRLDPMFHLAPCPVAALRNLLR